MKRPVQTIIAVLLFSLVSTIAASGYTNVSVGEAKTMVDSNPSLVVLDVRTQSEYDSGHIRNTTHIPLAELGGRLDELNETDSILVYCASGGRSASASQLLVDNGFLHIYNMLGGITAWISAGYPVYIKYSSIQEAINNASPGDTILVSSGIYYENVVVNKTLSLVGENREGAIIDGNGTGTAVTVLANDTRVTGFTMQNGLDEVMMVENVSRVEASQNNIFEPGVGFYGIHLWFSVEVALVDNLIINNHPLHIGIGIYGSNSCLISRNEISGGWAILLVGSNSSTISDNLLFSKGAYGIRLSWSHNNIICGNTILNASWYGLALDYASDYNTIFHNNFLNNTVQVGTPHYFTLNFWDNGCEGNYWSNYNGTDSDGDGIGDIAYVINENNTDPYPLMDHYWNSGDIDHNLKVDIFDVVLCANAYGCIPSSPNWNPHCDIAEPYGIINIFDLVMIATGYGEEYTP